MTPALAVVIGHAAGRASWFAATPAPTPPPSTVDPSAVTPGVLGFLVIFAVVLACIPLFLSMTSKLRKVERRRRLEELGDAQESREP